MNIEHLNLSTPLFQKPPEDLGEDSTWGFLVGGMAWIEDKLLADEFLLAADSLVEKALNGLDQSYHYMAPVLFLYRHALELYLKQIVKPTKRNHDLTSLIEQFEQFIARDFKQKLPALVKARLLEWATQDPKSTTYRYSESSAGTDAREWWVDLRHLRDVMGYFAENFRRIRALNGDQ